MKTTLDIDDRLLANAKATAAQERKTLTRIIEEADLAAFDPVCERARPCSEYRALGA